MMPIGKAFLGGIVALVAATTSASAQYNSAYDNDMACRQYADQAVAPMRDQANSQTVGSALVGAGLGAALGAAVGGGHGAAIGAGSGAIVGTGAGVANAQNAGAYIQQQYNAYYYQCMQQRSGPPPGYAAPQPAYGSPPGSYR
ncbi:MAG TPA: YMGG-like glycine zipper-containing protein [Stellaceae bacterium]